MMRRGTNSVHCAVETLGQARYVSGSGSLHGSSGRFTALVRRAIVRLRPTWALVGEPGRLEVAWPCDKNPPHVSAALEWLRRKGLLGGVTLYMSGREKTGASEAHRQAIYEVSGCSLVDMRLLASGTLTLCYVWATMRRMSHLPRRTHRGTRLPEWIQ